MTANLSLTNRLIAASIRHRVAVIAATLLLVAGGTWAFLTMNADAFPDLTPNQVLVMTTVPGLSPEEVEQQVTYPMELTMLGLPRTLSVRSASKASLSVVTITFEDDVDFYFARNLVQQRMQDAMGQLPEGAEPMLGPPSTAMGEVLQYLVESTGDARDTLSLIELSNVQEYLIRPLLRTVPGVADVNSWGGMDQQYEVLADPAKLAGHDITLDDIERALAANNANFGAGYIEDRSERLSIRGLGRVADSVGLARIVVATRGTTPVLIRDLARVTIGPRPRFGAVTRDGRGEALSATILMLKGSNGHQVVNRVKERIEEIRPLLPAGIGIRTFYSQGDVVDRTTATVFRNLTEGALLVVAVLLLFLRNWRASLVTASVIPLALLTAFIAMRFFGVTANLMSLGALDFGLIVDASVVMMENFMRRVADERAAAGETAGAAVVDQKAILREAAFEVGRPIVFGMAIIVAVYIPIFTLEGLEGRMFRPMAFTVCAAVLASLLLALAYIPAVSSYLFAKMKPGSHHDARWFIVLRERYQGWLAWALAHHGPVIGVAAGALAIAVISLRFIGTEFMPRLDEGYLLIETRRAPSVSLAGGIAVSEEIERTLKKFSEVTTVNTNLGRPREATETMPLNQGDVYINFAPRSEWKAESMEQFLEQADSALSEIPGLRFEFSAPMRMRLDEVISGVKTDLGIRVFGDSLELLNQKAEEILAVMHSVRGGEEAFVGVTDGAMQLEVTLNRAALARHGLSVADVRETMETGIAGMEATTIVDGRRRFPVVVRLESSYRATPEAVGQALIRTPAGGTVTLAQVASIRMVEAPEVINHEAGRRFVVVQANVRDRDLGGLVAELRREIAARVQLPPEYYVTYGGQFENQTRAMTRLGIIVPVVLLLIGVLLYASFGTVRYAMVVMLNVPFALVGGIAALWLRGLNLNLSASVGFIALFGVAVLNGVVLLTYINQLRAGGLSVLDAIRQGAEGRFRPVLMTALVASVGFIPMALSTSAGSEVQRPLATVVIGGLISSTILTLIVMPTVLAWLEERAATRLT